MAFRSIALTLENGFKKVVCQIDLEQLGAKVVKTVLKAMTGIGISLRENSRCSRADKRPDDEGK